jgi:hypothetical protein
LLRPGFSPPNGGRGKTAPLRLCVGLVAFALAIVARAQDEIDFDEWKITGEAGYTSRYVFRGVLRSRDAAQASARIGRSGWSADLRINQPLRDDDPREVRLGAGYKWHVAGQWVIEATGTSCRYEKTPTWRTGHSLEGGVSVAWESGGLFTPGVAWYHDFELRADTAQASLGYSVPLTKLGAYLEGKFFVGWAEARDLTPDAPGPRVRDGYGYYGVEARVPYRIGEHATLVASLSFADAVNQNRAWSPFAARGSLRAWGGLAVSFDF